MGAAGAGDGIELAGQTAGTTITMAGFTANVVVPCTFDTGAGLLQVAQVTVTPPPGTIAGYLLNDCGSTIVRGGRDIQLWIPPSNPGNQGGTFLTQTTTSVEGYFEFTGVNPCIIYELKIVVGTTTTVTTGVLAGATTVPYFNPTTQRPETVGQKYYISDAKGTICATFPGP